MKQLLLIAGLTIQTGFMFAQSAGKSATYANYTELGGLFGRVASGPVTAQQVENRLSFTAQTFNGAQITRRLAVGGLVGIDWYAAALLLPVGAGLRFDLLPNPQHNVRLLAIADAGYGLPWLNKSSTGYIVGGGWMLNPGLCLRLGPPTSSAFTMSLTYKRQEADVQKPLSGNDIRRDEYRVYNRLSFKIGIAF